MTGVSRAFTLLEVLLVIAIIIAVIAMAWPTFDGTFERQRLKKAGEQIQTEWARARNRSIRTGRVHVFQHATQSDRFFTRMQVSPDDAWQAEGESDTSQFVQSENSAKKLPENIFFLGADVQLDQRSSVELSSLEASPIVADFAMNAADDEITGQIDWGMPIFFFPDGTTSSAQLVLANDRQSTVTVYLRGLTGMSRVGPIESIGQSTIGGEFIR